MAFGQELKDFVAGFQSGYQLIESPEEKQRKRNEETRAQGRYDREGVWHEEESQWKKEGRAYDQSQDAMRWDWNREGRKLDEGWKQKEFDFRVNESTANRYREGVQDERANRAEQRELLRLQKEIQEMKDRRKQLEINAGDKSNPAVLEQIKKLDEIIGNSEAAANDITTAQKERTTKPAIQEPGQDDLGGGSDVIGGGQGEDDVDGNPRNDVIQNSGWREPQRPQEIAAQLVNDLQSDFGISRNAAIGVVGQLAHESGGFKSLQELNPMVQGSRGGWGYAQWTGPRRKQFEAFAEQNGFDPRSYAANYEFLKYELANTREGNVLRGLQNMDDPRQAGRYFTAKFLRPGIPGWGSRDKWTDRVGSLYARHGGLVQNYASGGFVGGIASGVQASGVLEDDDEDDGEKGKLRQWGDKVKGYITGDENNSASGGSDDAGSGYTSAPSDGNWGSPSGWTVNDPIKYARGGVVQKYAYGGSVLPEEDDEEVLGLYDPPDGVRVPTPEDRGPIYMSSEDTLEGNPSEDDLTGPGAIPEEGEEVTSESKEPYNAVDAYKQGIEASREAHKKTLEEFNKENPEGALEDPDLEARYEAFKSGYGAAPHQMMKQVFDTIDPDRKMTPSERNLKAMGYVYQYFNENGKPEEAKAAAASMLQYYRQNYTKFSTIAEAARQDGDMDTAMKAFVAAYAQVPNGKDLDLTANEDGTVTVTVTDQKTGKPITKKLANLEQIAAQAANMSPDDFDNMLMSAAGVEGDKIEVAEGAKPGSSEAGVQSDNLNDAFDAKFATADTDDGEGNVTTANPDAVFMDNTKRKTLLAAAKHLVTVKDDKGNVMNEAEAIDFLDPTSPEPFGKQNVPGRPGWYRVRRNGITKTMNSDQYNKVVADWKRIQQQKTKNEQDRYTQLEMDEADANDPNKQTDFLGALAEEAANPLGRKGGLEDRIIQSVTGGDESTERPAVKQNQQAEIRTLLEQRKASSNPDEIAALDERLGELGYTPEGALPEGGDRLVDVSQAPEAAQSSGDQSAIPEDDSGLLGQLFRTTPSKPADDIKKAITGQSVERLTENRRLLEAEIARAKDNPKEYGKTVGKKVAQLKQLNDQISQVLRDDIAALEDAARNQGENDTTDYNTEIKRRKQALAAHENRLRRQTK